MASIILLLVLTVGTLAEYEPQTITLNIGGTLFTTTAATVARYPDSLLAHDYRPSKSSYFYDRDGDIFRHVLNFLRSGRLLLPRDFDQFDLLKEEAVFFNLYYLRVPALTEKTNTVLHDEIEDFQEKQNPTDKIIDSQQPEMPVRAESQSKTKSRPKAADSDNNQTADDSYECVIVCADEDGKVERWFSAPVDIRFENDGCLLGDCEQVAGYSHVLDYRDYSARPGNTVPNHFNIAAIVARLLRAGFTLTASSSGMDEWHRQFYFVFVRKII